MFYAHVRMLSDVGPRCSASACVPGAGEHYLILRLQVRLRGECEAVENKLNASRNTELKLGYKDPAAADVFVEKSSVGLRTVMKTSDDEATRKAAWEGQYCPPTKLPINRCFQFCVRSIANS